MIALWRIEFEEDRNGKANREDLAFLGKVREVANIITSITKI